MDGARGEEEEGRGGEGSNSGMHKSPRLPLLLHRREEGHGEEAEGEGGGGETGTISRLPNMNSGRRGEGEEEEGGQEEINSGMLRLKHPHCMRREGFRTPHRIQGTAGIAGEDGGEGGKEGDGEGRHSFSGTKTSRSSPLQREWGRTGRFPSPRVVGGAGPVEGGGEVR